MSDRDFKREIYNLLGLSFDAISMDETVDEVLETIESGRKLFLSTPNLNFLIAAQKDNQFRNSVINSDLSIADGMPIVFMCKLLRIPIQERVAGSSLIEQLRSDQRCKQRPIKVFFFGGEEGVAESAHTVLNETSDGLVSTGHLNPGFGSVDDMSSDDIIEQINDAKPEFLIVSLGAKKGQAWIEANIDRLNVNVVSHLGAVVNFVAGKVKRAPAWIQTLHLEWLWRIKEEPALFSRYLKDGFSFLGLFFSKIIPYAIIVRRDRVYSTPGINIDKTSNTLALKGNITINQRDELRDKLQIFIKAKKNFVVDLNGVSYLDQSILGLLLITDKITRQNDISFKLVGVKNNVHRIIRLNKLGFLTDLS